MGHHISVQEKINMIAANVSTVTANGMPHALRRAQAAIRLPEVQAILQRLSEFELGIFMPHQHDMRTGEFQQLHHDLMQVESGCKVSFKRVEEIAHQGDRYLPVAWRWQAGAPIAASACEMVLDEEPGGAEALIKHKMPDQD
jgi:hypothetical protein